MLLNQAMHMQMLDGALNSVFDLSRRQYLVPRRLTFTGNLLFCAVRQLLISDELTSLSLERRCRQFVMKIGVGQNPVSTAAPLCLVELACIKQSLTKELDFATRLTK
jgi:hypothetical protein